MIIHLQTLTPIWTGGAETGVVDRIHETGILGSLRWWYEALVRGLGGQACDPSTHTCAFETEAFEKATTGSPAQRLHQAGLCDVCQVFGATGWRRRFRFVVQDDRLVDATIPSQIQARRSYTDRHGNLCTPTWYFPNKPKPKSGTFAIHIHPLTPSFPSEVIGGLVQFVADWSALGARSQMGFGVVKPIGEPTDTRVLFEWLGSLSKGSAVTHLPSLQDMFLARVRIPNATDQDTFDLKYDIRRIFAGAKNTPVRHFVMGTVDGQRLAAKVRVSRPYSDGELRVWGCIPRKSNAYGSDWSRERIVAAIFDYLDAKYDITLWREMSPTRDKTLSSAYDARSFLQSLLGLEEAPNGS